MRTCIIVDDQKESVDLIRDHVLKIPTLTIMYMTTDSVEALTFLDKNKPDIVFLDIEMPEMSGIEFIENLKARWGNDIPKVVFTTGYMNYALTGYEIGIFDYILKPVTFTRFKKCIDRLIDELDKRRDANEKPMFFFLEEDGKKLKINFVDIYYIEGAGNYITIYMSELRKTIYKSMSAIWELVPHDKFIRVHKSYIVAIERIHAIRGNELILKLKNSEVEIAIGITYKENFLKKLGIA